MNRVRHLTANEADVSLWSWTSRKHDCKVVDTNTLIKHCSAAASMEDSSFRKWFPLLPQAANLPVSGAGSFMCCCVLIPMFLPPYVIASSSLMCFILCLTIYPLLVCLRCVLLSSCARLSFLFLESGPASCLSWVSSSMIMFVFLFLSLPGFLELYLCLLVWSPDLNPFSD